MSQTKELREFEFWKFEFVFGFRYSDFGFSTPKPVWFRLCRVRDGYGALIKENRLPCLGLLDQDIEFPIMF
jgi:hypothetical protein